MSDQTSALPPPAPSAAVKPKKKWRWWQTVLVLVFGTYFVLKLFSSYNSVNLELTRTGALTRDDGKAITIVNVGTKPIQIVKITINDRSDCTLGTMSKDFTSPVDLKIGDKLTLMGPCRVIRANVETNDGSATYSFSGN